MTNSELIKLIDKLIKQIKKDFSHEFCEGFEWHCAICKANILINLLEDYKENTD